MNKIRVMNVFSRLNVGGPSIHTILLTARLNNSHFESILVKGQEDPYEGNMLYLAEEKDVKPFVIPEMGRKISFLHDLKALYKLYRFIKEYKPHIINTHTAKAGTLGRLAALFYNGINLTHNLLLPFSKRRNRVKVVHTFHGHVFNSYFNPVITKIFICIERFLAFTTDRIITVSEKQREEILCYGIGAGEKVVAIPLGLELERFLNLRGFCGALRKELGEADDVVLVGIVARLVPIKNHRMFVETVKTLRTMKKIKFLIVGDGEQREEILRLVKDYKLENNIHFLNFRSDLEKIYADLDIVVLTSLNEGSPIALIEAMASGKPVISTEVGGVRDLFQEGVEGFKVSSGDAENMARMIKHLAGDKGLRVSMGNRGRERVYPGYGIDALVDRMTSLYKELVQAN